MMTEGNFVQPAIHRFDGHYDHWSMLMENLLRSKEYWSLVETSYVELESGTVLTEAQQKKLDEMKLKDLKVKNYLFQAIDRTILETILQKNTSKQIWDSMKKYEGNERVKRSILQALRKEFETLEMKSGEGVSDYFSRVMSVANKMRVHGEQMRDVTIVEKILRSLNDKFNYIVCSIEESKDTDRLSIDELQSSLIQALKVTHEESTWGRGRGRGFFRGRGRGRGRQSFNKATVECYKCHKLGHFQYECPSWDKEANYAEVGEEEAMLLMSYVETNEAKKEDVWFLDLGCSNHMCGDKALFCDFTESFRQMVKLGNNSKMTVMGKGNIKLKMNGLNHIVTKVFYVPELKNNLLSIGQLQGKGLAILIQHGKCKAYHPKKGLIIQAEMSANRMFTLLAASRPKKPACFHTAIQDLSHLWHYRYGHLSHKGLRTLQNKKMVNGLPQFEASKTMCIDCMVGKQHRDPIPKKSTWRASSKLQLIHADICGLITLISNSKKRYLISFIDDFSRKVWIYFLVKKSEALVIFKQYKSCVEKETGSYIMCLHTDRGGEFTSQEFDEFCKENGIKRQLTTAYTLQQNGVAERKNRTIMNMTFWPEAVNWTVHILNRSPTLAAKNITPEEARSGVKPSVEHFRVFGYISHVHVPDVKRTKLEDKSFTCVLLGVSEESKAYRLYDPIAKKIVISRDVVFEEEKSWDWDKSYEEQVVVVLEWGDNEENAATNNEDEAEIEDGSSAEEVAADSPNLVEEESSPSSIEGRVRRPPVWMRDYEMGEGLSEEEDETNLALFASADPLYFEEAVKSAKWRAAMDSEIKSIENNDTWVLTDSPAGAKKIGVKWIYKTKLNEHGNVDKYKARLVAKGYTQQHGVDYIEVFAPVARMDTIRIIIALVAQKSWTIYQLDVKSTFLHGELSEEVFVEQPRGYEQKDNPHKIYKLKKALYGLKQAPRAWFNRIEAHLVNEGFERCHSENTLFVKTSKGGKILIVSLYVDDLIFTRNDESMFYEFKSSMMREFDMTNLGKMRYFLGVEVLQKTDGIYIRQKKYALDVLKRFGMEESNFVHNPIVPGFKVFKDESGVKVDITFFKQVVGSLMYLTSTRPDLMFVVSLISRYMGQPTELHLQAAKRVLRYLKGTTNLGIFYKKGGNDKLVAFTDSDYAGDLEDRKSTSGYASKKQPIVSLSTTETEFIAATSCTCQAVWMRRILEKLSHTQGNCTTVFCDNSSTIKLSKNPVMHGRSKHIDVRFHFLCDLTKEGVVELVHYGTQDQIADMMTKPLKLDTFLKLRKLMGVCEVPDSN
uniref:Retrovirus-related Pol polyprotein from transposon TNT 1-94 n=1 Tax=Nelumbo nucifera TaxID=4432 RepID=A0A822Z8D1_NELNU|nr:TPA_asm: hypothetical protein HUJ06_015430 [Nelumbo nucifera]